MGFDVTGTEYRVVGTVATHHKVITMKPMIWHPEEHDQKVNQYLEQVNHAPYALILGLGLATICLLSLFILIGIF
jgi:hypothetical protein